MPGLGLPDNAAVPQTPPAVALTVTTPSSRENAVRILPQPQEVTAEEPGWHWPLGFMTRESYKKGECLFKIGDRAEKLFYIAQGVIRLPELNRLLRAGEVLGEMGLFSPGRQRTATAVAEEDVQVFTMGGEEVKRLMSRDPNLAINLMQVSVKRLIENLKRETEAQERMKTELRVAHEIQTSLLPRTFPPFPGRKDFDIYAMMEPAKEVGGDLYDFFLVDQNKLCVVVGDVSGKGVPAALFMAITKALLKSEAMRHYPAGEVLARVNNLICSDNRECMFVTAFCLLLDTQTGEAECCSAGHNPPLLCCADGSVDYLRVPSGFVVGFEENVSFQSKNIHLKPGEMILLYTDGVTEAENPKQEIFSEARLRACVSGLQKLPVRELIEGVRHELAHHVQSHPQSDDITMVALKYNGPPGKS